MELAVLMINFNLILVLSCISAGAADTPTAHSLTPCFSCLPGRDGRDGQKWDPGSTGQPGAPGP